MSDTSNNSHSLFIQLASLLLHDLETPLAVVKQFLKRVEEGRHDPDNPRHQKLMASTQLAVQRGERILEDLLDQARNGSLDIRVNRFPTNIRKIVLDCIQMTSPLAEDRMIQVLPSFDSKVTDTAELDSSLIMRVIDNLLVNAIRHAPKLTTIEIAVRKSENGFRVEVINRAEKDFDIDLEHIFDLTYQIQMRQQRRIRGSGLGLIFSQRVLLAHGGSIGAHWEDGSKVVFWFEIPIHGQGDTHGGTN